MKNASMLKIVKGNDQSNKYKEKKTSSEKKKVANSDQNERHQGDARENGIEMGSERQV